MKKETEKMRLSARFKIGFRTMVMAVLAVCLMAGLSGCGKGGDGQEQADGTEGFVYVPEYQKLALDFEYINQVSVAGDDMYMAVMIQDEEDDQYKNSIYKYNLLENTAQEIPVADLDENSDIRCLLMSGDGNLVLVVSQYDYVMDDNGEVVDGSTTMELRRVSAQDGAVISAQDMSGIVNNIENIYIQSMCEDGQGNLYLSDGDERIYVIDKDFKKLCDITVDGWVNSMTASKEGDVYISTYGENGEVLKKVDVAAKKLGEAVEGVEDSSGNVHYFTGASKSLMLSSSSKAALIDLQAGTTEELFGWLDVDIDGNEVDIAGELSDGRIWTLTREYNNESGNSYELVYLSRKKASEIPAKEEIVYGAMWLDSNMRKAVIDFNKASDKYRIRVKEYGLDDYQTGLAQFNADLTTQDCPDLIGLNAIDFEQYASKGILEDLYPYMEKSGLHKEDYLENILKAYEADGKLCGITSQFYITSTLAKASLVGEEGGWTLSEMLDFVDKNNPENVFMYGSRGIIFRYCIYNNIDEFIDWETGKCFFDGEEFIRTLEFAAKFPEEPDYEREQEEGISSKLRSDKVLLMESSITSVQEYQMMNGLYGEKVTYIGYPNSDRQGNLVQPATGNMGISSKSKSKDGAWEFIQSVISEEYQDSLVSEYHSWGFPISKSALEKQFEKDMTPDYYEDEEGNQVEASKTTWGYDDFEMEIMAATQEEVDAVRELITSADRLSGNVDEQLINIITEEADPFFKGQKSAADAAGVIQNRIQIYVNENS